MIGVILLALLAPNHPAGAERAGNRLCHLSPDKENFGELNVKAIIEFDGLEYTFISGISCRRSRAVEVVKGFSLPGKNGLDFYNNIISSAKKSSKNARYGVEFYGKILVHKNNDHVFVVDIISVEKSRIVLLN